MKVTEFISQSNQVYFSYFRQGVLYYAVNHIESGDTYIFPVPWTDLGGATVGHTEKSIIMMRWIRESIENGTMVKEQ